MPFCVRALISPIAGALTVLVLTLYFMTHSQDPPERSSKFVDELKLGFRILHDEKREVMAEWGVGRTLMGFLDSERPFALHTGHHFQDVVRVWLEHSDTDHPASFRPHTCRPMHICH